MVFPWFSHGFPMVFPYFPPVSDVFDPFFSCFAPPRTGSAVRWEGMWKVTTWSRCRWRPCC